MAPYERSQLGAFLTLRRNPLELWGPAAYEKDILAGKFFGRQQLMLNAPDAIKHVLVTNADNYGRNSGARRVLQPLLGFDTVTLLGIQSAGFALVPFVFAAGILYGGFARTGELDELAAWLGSQVHDEGSLRDVLAHALSRAVAEVGWSPPRTTPRLVLVTPPTRLPTRWRRRSSPCARCFSRRPP